MFQDVSFLDHATPVRKGFGSIGQALLEEEDNVLKRPPFGLAVKALKVRVLLEPFGRGSSIQALRQPTYKSRFARADQARNRDVGRFSRRHLSSVAQNHAVPSAW